MSQPFIQVKDLNKVYKTPAGDFPALKNINFEVQAGGFTLVVGKSGAGKSTLINMVTGVDSATSGEIWIDGQAIHTLSENEMALWRGMNVGVIYQSFQLLPKLTIMDNILIPMDFCDLYKPVKSQEWAMSILDKVELADQAHKLPSTLSGGQQQRAAIARALANDPPLIVADEPTGNLDTNTAEVIFELFRKLVDEGKTIFMVTHDESLIQRSDHVYHIYDGELAVAEPA
ncbi:MAG: ABC transporter ATP-binding protein [Anaerolineaceae bacterium]|nr:ABC transporter ATP-binding protein [Anaerolineaceae bacterium]